MSSPMLVLTCAWPCRVCQPQETLMENIQQQQSLGLSKAGWQGEDAAKVKHRCVQCMASGPICAAEGNCRFIEAL